MKKTIITALLSLGLISNATADTIKISDLGATFSDHWVYFYQSDGTWDALKKASDKSLTENQTASKSTKNYVLYGYDFLYQDDVQYAVSNTTEFVAKGNHGSNWAEGTHVYVAEMVTFSLYGIGRTGATYTFLDLGANAKTLITCAAANAQNGLKVDGMLTLAGNLKLTGETFTRTLYSGLINGNSANVFNVANLTVTDTTGSLLSYTADENNIGKTGYFWLTTTQNGDSYTYTLNARGSAAIPEPTTATLSLLALAGLASRRRRK